LLVLILYKILLPSSLRMKQFKKLPLCLLKTKPLLSSETSGTTHPTIQQPNRNVCFLPAPHPPPHYLTTIRCQNGCICQVVAQDNRLMLASKYVHTLYESGRWGMRCEWSRCRYVTSLKPVGAARPPTEPLLHFI
jgi:hypothetical protein